jgi:tetratricopeptide (TPR) repeat protein
LGFLWFYWPISLPEPPVVDSEEPEVRQVLQQAYQKLLQQRRSAAAWGEYGTLLLAHLFDQQADICFIVAGQLDPQDPRWPYARSHIALKRRPHEAIELLRQAIQASQGQRAYLFVSEMTLAEALLERGEFSEAMALFRKYLQPPPGEPRARWGMSLSALAAGQEEQAWQYMLAVRDHPCCRKQAHTQLAALARRRGDVTTALQYEAIANHAEPDPPWPDPYLDHVVSLQVGRRGLERRAGILERDGRFFEAAQLYLSALHHERSTNALLGAAVNLARLHQHPEALKLLREAIALDPDNARVQYTFALVLYAHAEIVQSHQPDYSELRQWFHESAQAARRATELKPDHARAYLFWGLSLLQLGQSEAAIAPLRQGLKIEPDNFDMHLALGQALSQVGQFAEAEKALLTASQIRPEDPRLLQQLQRLPRR